MDRILGWAFAAAWLGWLAYWIISAFRVRPTKKAQPAAVRIVYRLEMVAAFDLVASQRLDIGWLGLQLWSPNEFVSFSGLVLTIVGLGFAVWARVHIGEFWSGSITLKEGHRLIRTGPYALVRHPIYTGLIVAMAGTAVAVDRVRAVIGLVVMVESLVRKYRTEERWLVGEFGEEYLAYRRAVRALF